MGGKLLSIIEEHKALKEFDESDDRDELESLVCTQNKLIFYLYLFKNIT